jgi:2-polyprenyl-3-methyl-5-hydroxy-6-metoxy-1,4-benzoquinol methylase
MTKSRYHYEFDPEGDGVAARVVQLTGSAKKVLELGCASGAMSKVLFERYNCSIFGVELTEEIGRQAAPYCKNISFVDIEHANWNKELGDELFDVIIAADVLEHLRDPVRCLLSLREYLAPGGYFVISIPNISYNGILAELFGNDFQYRKVGLLDETHLRFWGLKGIKRLAEDSRLTVNNLHFVRLSEDRSEFAIAWRNLPAWLRNAFSSRSLGNVYQFVFKLTTDYDQICLDQYFANYHDNYPHEIELDYLLDAVESRMEIARNKLETDNHILNKKLNDVSEWGSKLQSTLIERDNQILSLVKDLNIKQNELMQMSDWASSMRLELMQMSDWASSMRLELEKMRLELEKYRLSIKFQVKSLAKLTLKRLFQKLKIAKLVVNIKQYLLRINKNLNLKQLREDLNESKGKLIIVFPVIVWDFRWQRPQQLISRLCKHGYTILYSAMSFIQNENTFASRFEASIKMTVEQLQKGIYQFWPSSKNNINIYQDELKECDIKSIFDGIASLIEDLKPQSIIYVVHFPGWWPIVERLESEFKGKIIFDCMDDHAGFSTNSKTIITLEKELIEKADLLISSSQLLYEKLSQNTDNCIQIKNGTEFKHFFERTPNGELDYISSKPIIGYYGAISDWFDVDLLAYCARNRPQYNFVLIGSTFGADITTIDKIENIFLLGEKTYQSLPGYLAYFDVCLIPFKLIPLTMATNPVKFYEYLSAGKPVVSVKLPELTEYADYCYLANNYEEFLIQIDYAYQSKDDLKLINMRLDLARNNSWDSRVDVILKNSCFK